MGVGSQPQFGPHPVTVESLWNIAPEVLESIAQWIEQRGLRTPVSQVVGFQQFLVQPATTITALEGTSSTSYGDLATVGPSLTLADGKYLILFGTKVFGESTLSNGLMSPSINGATAQDSDGVQGGGPDDSTDALPPSTLSKALAVTLDAGGANTVVAKYRSAHAGVTADFQDRWLIALRYANIR